MKFRICLQFIWLMTLLEFIPSSSSTRRSNGETPAYRICKPGPPNVAGPKTSRKCLVIGDSVSIGYTRWVAESLKETCHVTHAPWDYVDGGALDSKYGLQCLQFLLSTSNLDPVRYDAIVFNFGLHDVDYGGSSPEEFTPAEEYRRNLGRLKESLLETGTEVGFLSTTPIPYSVTRNERVIEYNLTADDIMSEAPLVETANLYGWVVKVCGEPPYNSCKIAGKQPSPHYTVDGYKYLARLVTQLFQDLLAKKENRVEEWYYLKDMTNENSGGDFHTIQCKDKSGKVVTACPRDTTCSSSIYSACGIGCCLLPNAVQCGDGKHCCPADYTCDPQCNADRCYCLSHNYRTLFPVPLGIQNGRNMTLI